MVRSLFRKFLDTSSQIPLILESWVRLWRHQVLNTENYRRPIPFHIPWRYKGGQTFIVVSDVDRVERFRLTLRFFGDISTASWFNFSIPTSIFRRLVGIFSLFFLCCFYFILKVHVNFFQFSIGTRAAVSKYSRPCCRNAPLSHLHFDFLSEICNGQPECLCALLL